MLSTLTAVGRVAAEAVIAPLSLPPFPASAMDGYALRSKDLTGPPPYAMTVAGRSFAGHPFTDEVPSREAVRIYTGAPVPKGLDAVVIQEDCDAEDSGVIIRKTVSPGDNIRPIGLDVRAGQTLFSPGTQISAFHAGWMSACGVIDINAFKRPRVAIFSTGDELVEPGSTLGQGQIYDANRHLLHLMLSRLPVLVEDFGILPDDPERIRTALDKAAGTCDAIVTSGGVSVGDADWVKHIVENMGNLQFWKLNLKPGKPMAYGRLGRSPVFRPSGKPGIHSSDGASACETRVVKAVRVPLSAATVLSSPTEDCNHAPPRPGRVSTGICRRAEWRTRRVVDWRPEFQSSGHIRRSQLPDSNF